MYYWAGVHPYNGITIVRVEGPADVARLRRVAAGVHEELGISRLTSHDRTYELASGGADVPVETVCATGTDDLESLAVRATGELNRPFDDGPSLPVRLFVLQRHGYHYIGRTYQHWIGDASSMNALLCRVLASYLEVDPPAALNAEDRTCPPFRRVFSNAAGPFGWCRQAAAIVGQLIRFRRCHAPRFGNQTDFTNRARFLTFPGETLPRLIDASRRLGVTVHDLLLAALAEGVALATPERLADMRRRDLAFTTIVDLRRMQPDRLAGRMGLYLSYFNVLCSAGDSGFDELLRSIHTQTVGAKSRRAHLAGLLELQLAGLLWPRIPVADRVAFFSHRRPVAGAVTDVRIRPEWLAGRFGRAVTGWWRVAPTGPFVPLALTATRAGDRLTCCLTTRSSGYTNEAIETIGRAFLDRLCAL